MSDNDGLAINNHITADTMHIAYSALRDTDTTETREENKHTNAQLQGYLAACKKYSHEIAAIQQYIPGWIPKLPLLCTEK